MSLKTIKIKNIIRKRKGYTKFEKKMIDEKAIRLNRISDIKEACEGRRSMS